MQNLKKKSGGHSILCSPPSEKVGGHVPRVPHQIAPMVLRNLFLLIQIVCFHQNKS